MSFKKHILLFSSMVIALLLYQLLNGTYIQKVTPLATGAIPKHLSCGPAALIKVSQAHSEKITNRLYALLRSDEKSKEPITSFYDLMNWSKAVGMKPIGLKIETTDLTKIPLPAIVHINQNHFLALTAIDDKKAALVDQGNLTKQITLKNFEDMFTGYALCFN